MSELLNVDSCLLCLKAPYYEGHSPCKQTFWDCKLPHVFHLVTSLFLFVQQVHHYLHDKLEAFHFLLDRATHTSIGKAHGATDIYRLISPSREHFRKPCREVERCAVGKEWCAQRLTRCGPLWVSSQLTPHRNCSTFLNTYVRHSIHQRS